MARRRCERMLGYFQMLLIPAKALALNLPLQNILYRPFRPTLPVVL